MKSLRTGMFLGLLALLGLPSFVVWELRRRDPAVDLRVLRHRYLAAGSIFSFVLGIGLYGTIFVVPIFAQAILGYTATQTGLLILPGALASAVTMAILGRASQRLDPRLLISVGAVLMVLTMLSLGSIGPDTGSDQLFWPLILRGITTVMMFLPLSLAALGPLPKSDVGAGSGFFNLMRQLGGTFGIAVLTVVLDHQRAVHRAQLVGFNAASSDLPILIQRGIANGCNCPTFGQRPDKPWQGIDYLARFSEGHLDLAQVLMAGGFGSSVMPSLDEIAAACGNPKASRAIGRANATNPICVIVPCHRVIGADGSLTGFAYGEDLKRLLLQHEGALLR